MIDLMGAVNVMCDHPEKFRRPFPEEPKDYECSQCGEWVVSIKYAKVIHPAVMQHLMAKTGGMIDMKDTIGAGCNWSEPESLFA